MYCTVYSVIQSDLNSFYGDVVLDSASMASRIEDSTLGQIYEKLICLGLYYEGFLSFIVHDRRNLYLLFIHLV